MVRDLGWGKLESLEELEDKQLKELKDVTTTLGIPFHVESFEQFESSCTDCPMGQGAYGDVWGDVDTVTKLTEINVDEVKYHYDAGKLGLCPPLIKVYLIQNPDDENLMALTSKRVDYEMSDMDLLGDPSELPLIDKALAAKVPLIDVIQEKYGRCNIDAKIHNWMYNILPNNKEYDAFLVDWSHRLVRDISPEQCSQTVAATLILQIYENLEKLNKLPLMEKPQKKLMLPNDCNNKCVSRIVQVGLLDRNRDAKRFARNNLPKLFNIAKGILPISKPFHFEFK